MTNAAKARLGFIGTGTITAAIIEGLSASGEEAIVVSPRNADIAADLSFRFANVERAENNQAVLDRSEVVVLAVRPQVAQTVLGPLRFQADHRVISLIATVSLDQLRHWAAPASQIVRAVPLPSVASGDGPTAIFPPDAEVRALFNRLGSAMELSQESEFDIFAAATATMASYFAFAHSITDWMEREGIEASQARSFITQMLKGLTKTAIAAPSSSFASLAEEHQTRGGINEQLFRNLTRSGTVPGIAPGLDQVLARLRDPGPKKSRSEPIEG
ncbi:pyrroline-5-carboxylate reductase [Pelagerythrobacter aerophilus]